MKDFFLFRRDSVDLALFLFYVYENFSSKFFCFVNMTLKLLCCCPFCEFILLGKFLGQVLWYILREWDQDQGYGQIW